MTGVKRIRVMTFVTDDAQYEVLRSSLVSSGFAPADLHAVDNTNHNRSDPYRGVNAVLASMPEDYLLLVHQDVVLDRGAGHAELIVRLEELDRAHPRWSVAGTAGLSVYGQQVLSVRDPWAAPEWPGPWPVRAQTLDEHFLVIRRETRARFCESLTGWHWYGTDLVLSGRRAGEEAWVVDFPITHLSSGTPDGCYEQIAQAMVTQHSPYYRFGLVTASTGVTLVLSRSPALRRFGSRARVLSVLRHPLVTRACLRFSRYGLIANRGRQRS